MSFGFLHPPMSSLQVSSPFQWTSGSSTSLTSKFLFWSEDPTSNQTRPVGYGTSVCIRVCRLHTLIRLIEVILLLTDDGDQRRPGPDHPGHCRHPRQHDADGWNVVSAHHGDVSRLLIDLLFLYRNFLIKKCFFFNDVFNLLHKHIYIYIYTLGLCDFGQNYVLKILSKYFMLISKEKQLTFRVENEVQPVTKQG